MADRKPGMRGADHSGFTKTTVVHRGRVRPARLPGNKDVVGDNERRNKYAVNVHIHTLSSPAPAAWLKVGRKQAIELRRRGHREM